MESEVVAQRKTKRDERLTRCKEFLARVRDMCNKDKSFRVILKRAAGTTLSNADSATVMAFYRIYYEGFHYPYADEKCFLVACLQCLWDVDEYHNAVALPAAVGRMDESSRESFRKKILSVMDMPWDNDGFFSAKIFRLVKFCMSKGIVVDCAELLCSLLTWDDVYMSTRKEWAKLFNIALRNEKGE